MPHTLKTRDRAKDRVGYDDRLRREVKKKPQTIAPAPPPSRLPSYLSAAAILAAYACALIYQRKSIPPGFNNDVVEEALRGIYLVAGRHLEVITFSLGNSAETLYLYVMGLTTQIFGPSMLAVQLPSWICALTCLWLLWKLVQRTTDAAPQWVALMAGACSLWLFHFARSGARVMCSPLFLAASALMLDQAERKPGDRKTQLLCGAVMGLSIYGYTSNRAIAIAFVVYALYRLIRPGDEARRAAFIRYATIAAGAVLISIPNIWFFVQRPKDFLVRGSYVFRGGAADLLMNTSASALFPFYYLDRFRRFTGPSFQFDGQSATFTTAGFNPMPLLFAAALFWGLWIARSMLAKPVPAFMLAAWASVVFSVGIGGPSPARLLILWPAFFLFVALGVGLTIKDRPRFKIPAALLLLGIGAYDGFSYFSNPAAGADYYAGSSTAIGEEAAKDATGGHRVLCIISRDVNAIRYLTWNQQDRVKVVEFFNRPLNPAELPLQEFQPDVILLEDTPNFRRVKELFPTERIFGASGDFLAIRLSGQ